MYIVGVTGGIGSGKSSVTKLLESKGVAVVDADIVAREVVEPGQPALEKIKQHFGPEAINSDGTLDRAELRSIVFKSPEQRKWLEGLLHPVIREEIVRQLEAAQSEYAVLASPLLLETDQHLLANHIVVIDLPVEMQIQRTTARDNNSEEQVRAIIAAQISREDRLKRADSVIHNDKDLSSLENAVLNLHQQLLNQTQKNKND